MHIIFQPAALITVAKIIIIPYLSPVIIIGSIIPLPMVLATAVPRKYAPMNSKIHAKNIAFAGVSALVPITVATMFAESLNPFEKSKTNARTTIKIPIISVVSIILLKNFIQNKKRQAGYKSAGRNRYKPCNSHILSDLPSYHFGTKGGAGAHHRR